LCLDRRGQGIRISRLHVRSPVANPGKEERQERKREVWDGVKTRREALATIGKVVVGAVAFVAATLVGLGA